MSRDTWQWAISCAASILFFLGLFDTDTAFLLLLSLPQLHTRFGSIVVFEMYISTSRSMPSVISYLASLLLLIGILHSNVVSTAPIDDDLRSRMVGGIAPLIIHEGTYPDIATCRERCSIVEDKSMFYSKVGKHEDKPANYASKNGLKLVREAYPSDSQTKTTRKRATPNLRSASRRRLPRRPRGSRTSCCQPMERPMSRRAYGSNLKSRR